MSTPRFTAQYLTPRRLAEILPARPGTVRYWIRHYPNIAVKIGGRYYIPIENVRQIIRGVPLSSVGATSQEPADGQYCQENSPEGQAEFEFA